MSEYRHYRRQSRRLALCGLMTALSVTLLAMGSFVPLATFACPMLAMLCLIPVICEYGAQTGLMVYAASVALFYLFLGWYPACRERLDRLPGVLRALVKCGVFTMSMTVMYLLILYLFRLEAVAAEFAGYTMWGIAGMLVVGNVTFLLLDRMLNRLTALYWFKRRKKR